MLRQTKFFKLNIDCTYQDFTVGAPVTYTEFGRLNQAVLSDCLALYFTEPSIRRFLGI